MQRCNMCYGDTRGECIRRKRCLYVKPKSAYNGANYYAVLAFAFSALAAGLIIFLYLVLYA